MGCLDYDSYTDDGSSARMADTPLEQKIFEIDLKE